MRTWPRFSVTCVAVVIVILFGLKITAANRASVRIAANLPLTGDLAIYGTAISQGAKMAAEDLQHKDPNGPNLDFDWADNSGSARTAATVLQRQYLSQPDIYVSGLKPQTMAITDQISKKGTPHFVWILDIAINRKSRNNLRTWINFKLESDVFLAYIRSKHPKRVAIIYTNLPAPAEQYNQYIAPKLESDGIRDVLILPYDNNRTEFKDIAVRINDFKPDLLILSGWATQLVGQIRAFRPFSLIKPGNTLACLDMLEAARVLGPDEVEGIVVAAPRYLTQPNEERQQAWRKRFKARYGKEPTYHSAFAYDMVLMINAAGLQLTLPAKPEQWIDKIRATKVDGVTGALHLDDDGSLETIMEPAIYKNGKLIALKQLHKPVK